MDQVSRPVLIALLGTLLFACAWMTVLRPQPAPEEVATPAAAPAAPATAATTPTTPAAPAPAAPEAAAPQAAAPEPETPAERTRAERSRLAGARQEAAVLRDVRAGRVSVLVLWDRRGADDRAARRAALGVDRRDGRVRVHVAPISRIAGFARLTQTVAVTQSPTTVVVSRRGRARTVVGLTDRAEVDQLVGDALARP